MFFFFVGGLNQQVSRVLKRNAGRCIACGSFADLVEYDKVLKVFFVPVWKWPGKESIMHCRNCQLFFPPSISPDVLSCCQYCHREFDAAAADFRFCPFCGSAL